MGPTPPPPAQRRPRDNRPSRFTCSNGLAALVLGVALLGQGSIGRLVDQAATPTVHEPALVAFVQPRAPLAIPRPPAPPPVPSPPRIPAPPSPPAVPGAPANLRPAPALPGAHALPGGPALPGDPALPGGPAAVPPAPGLPDPGAPSAGPAPAEPDLPDVRLPADPGLPADSGPPEDAISASAHGAVPDASRGPARQLRIFLTGYSFHDNTPPLSAIISHPILHRAAGGQGTYRDPITVAVPGSATTMKWRPGTRFYLPSVRRYVIVEDSGASPAPPGADTHLDMWIGGQGGSRGATDDCMSKLTGNVPAVLNPPPGLPVLAGPIFANRDCRLPLLSLAAPVSRPGPAARPAPASRPGPAHRPAVRPGRPPARVVVRG